MRTFYYFAQTYKSQRPSTVLPGRVFQSEAAALHAASSPRKGLLPGVVKSRVPNLSAGDEIPDGVIILRTKSA